MNKQELFDANFYAERIQETPSGVLKIPTYLINKYRKYSGNYTDHNIIIKQKIIDKCRAAGTGI